MLEVTNLTKKYNNVIANNKLSFNVEQGKVALLLGPNGAGKTTSINCIAGLLSYSGNISIKKYNNKSIEAKKIFGYVPEVPVPYEYLTIYEHLEFISKVYNVSNWENKAELLLRRFALFDKKNKLGKELSKGMKQKLSICSALLHNPKLLILDEPMVGLDPYAIKELKVIIKELKNKGCAILISTHILDSVNDIWDKAFILKDGKLISTKYRNSIKDKESLEELFFSIVNNEEVV